jgi:hypothetical protein
MTDPLPPYEYSIKSRSKKKDIYKEQYEAQCNYEMTHPEFKTPSYRPSYFNQEDNLQVPSSTSTSSSSFSITTHNRRRLAMLNHYKRQNRKKITMENDSVSEQINAMYS